MRRRDGYRRAVSLVATPRHASVSLPELTVDAPPATPSEVDALARDYAVAHSHRLGVSVDRLESAARGALYKELPPSIKKAEVIERLQGIRK